MYAYIHREALIHHLVTFPSAPKRITTSCRWYVRGTFLVVRDGRGGVSDCFYSIQERTRQDHVT